MHPRWSKIDLTYKQQPFWTIKLARDLSLDCFPKRNQSLWRRVLFIRRHVTIKFLTFVKICRKYQVIHVHLSLLMRSRAGPFWSPGSPCELNPARVIFEKITRNSRASAILAEPSCVVKDKKDSGRRKGLSSQIELSAYCCSTQASHQRASQSICF
jgi:hypothetical protein